MRLPQINCIKEMGFESLLNMNIDSIPTRLAYNIVYNFDTKHMVIRTRNGPIKVTAASVNHILGLKNEGIDITELETNSEWDEIIKNWKSQFDKQLIRPRDVVKKMTESHTADWNFKLNFIVLFMNSMCAGMKMGTCNLAILSHLGKGLNFKNVNWCKYIIDCAEESKIGWNAESDSNFYTGPITFLTLLYLDSTKCPGLLHKRVRPAIKEWNTEKMKTREKMEISNGGFGRGGFAEEFEETEDRDENSKDKKTTKEFLKILDQSLEELFANKAEIEYNLKQAMILYPNKNNLIDWKSSYERSFPTRSEMICLKDNVDNAEKREEFVKISGGEEKEKMEEDKEEEIEKMEGDKKEEIEKMEKDKEENIKKM